MRPNGTVITPLVRLLSTDILSFISTDVGANWNASTEISPITDHTEAGNLRSGSPPSAEIDGWNAPTFFYTGEMQPFNPKEYKRYVAVFNL